MISKTEMLEGMAKVDFKLTNVLHSWTKNECTNLRGFISNPSAHVNHNPYMILNYSKLEQRAQLLSIIENHMFTITEFKKGNPDYTNSMYEDAVDGTHVLLLERLLAWLEKRHLEMTTFISTGGNADSTAPTDEYDGMFAFNVTKFMEEYNMYKEAIDGCKVVVQYKREQMELANIGKEVVVEEPLLTTDEPPQPTEF